MDIFERGKRLLRERVGQQKQAVVAIVIKNRKIVSVGFNSYSKTHPKQAVLARRNGFPKKQYLHAEIAALIKSPKNADTIIVLRMNKRGELCNAKPCPICEEAIKIAGLKVIHS